MSTESRSNFNNVQVPGLFAVASESFKRYPDEWKAYYSTRTSTKAYEESGYVSGFGYLNNKPEGTLIEYDARIQGPVKRWTHQSWGLACRITEEAIDDDQYQIMNDAMKHLGVSAAATRHLLATRMLMNGTATTYHAAGDALAIFSGSHVRLDGATWSNLGSSADPTEASLEAAVKNFESITDHRGKRYDQKAEGIVCGPAWEFKFEKLLESGKESETPNNAVNALKRRRSLKLHLDHEITDERWFVKGMKDNSIGFIWFDRRKPTLARHGDPDTGDSKFMVKMRCSNECNDPRSMYMVPAFT